MSRDAQTGRDDAAPADDMAAYRATVGALVRGCIERIARWPLPADTEPLTTWRPDHD